MFLNKSPTKMCLAKKTKKQKPTSQLKGNQCEDARWPENVENVQTSKRVKGTLFILTKRQHAHFWDQPFFQTTKKKKKKKKVWANKHVNNS